MEKRLLTALALSTLILLLWAWLGPRNERPAPPPTPPASVAPVTASTGDASEGAPSSSVPPIGDVTPALESQPLVLMIGEPGQPGSYRATFSNRGARLTELKLANYYDVVGLSDAEKLAPEHWSTLLTVADPAVSGGGSLAWRSDASSRDLEREPLDRALWDMRELGPTERGPGVEFTLAQGAGVRFTKRVRFERGTYRMHVELELENQALDGVRRLGFLFTPAEFVPAEAHDKYYVEPQAIAAGRSEIALRENGPVVAESVVRQDTPSETSGAFDIPQTRLGFAGAHNKYFAVLLRAADATSQTAFQSARWWRARDEAWARANPAQANKAWQFIATDAVLQLDLPARGAKSSYAYVVYAGPKDAQVLEAESADFAVLPDHDLGTFLGIDMSGVGHVMLAILSFFHGLTGNWGVAIILLTLVVRLILFPINRRSQTAMGRYAKKMKRVQPQLDEIKKRHEKDPDKLRKAQAEIMQREGMVPPLGGCLPLFLQLPVFVGLFSALRASFDLRQAPFFGWITDLSKPDQLLRIDLQLPLVGSVPYLNLLPILMVIVWLGQQMTMPKPTDEQAARMQKMMMFMPVVMGFFLYDYAAGLSLYMITQSVLGIIEQTAVKKVWPIDDTEQPRKEGGWFANLQKRAVDMQKQQEARKRGGGTVATKKKKRY